MLRLQSLQFGYRDKTILAEPTVGKNYQFETGNLVCLIGRNGSGKSTLLRVLANLQPPKAGSLFLANIDYKEYSPVDFAKQLSIVTTERINSPFLSVYELVALGRHPHLSFGGYLKEEDHQKIKYALDLVGIKDLARKMLSQCSDGERQSAMLARALAQDTSVMLLDEITAHLDFVHRHRSFSLLKELAEKENKLIVMATHEIELALTYSHQMMLLYDGNLAVYAPEEIQNNGILASVFEGYANK